MPFAPGTRIGEYEVLSPIGSGGMGEVFKVRNVLSHRIDAMKVLRAGMDRDLLDRFLREIRIHAQLEHPNIANMRTAMKHGDQVLLLVEYVEGQSLEALLQQTRLSPEQAVYLISQVLDALEYAHQRGVIHRDLKPSNIMVTGAGHVKVLDFGIARAASDQNLTRTGVMVGSLPYMSPEQVLNRPLDVRSDIYSVGVTLYEMLSGRRPFEANSDFEIMQAHLNQTPPPLSALRPGLPGAVVAAVNRALDKVPERRFASCAEMRSALFGQAHAPTQALPVAVTGRPNMRIALAVFAGLGLASGALSVAVSFVATSWLTMGAPGVLFGAATWAGFVWLSKISIGRGIAWFIAMSVAWQAGLRTAVWAHSLVSSNQMLVAGVVGGAVGALAIWLTAVAGDKRFRGLVPVLVMVSAGALAGLPLGAGSLDWSLFPVWQAVMALCLAFFHFRPARP